MSDKQNSYLSNLPESRIGKTLRRLTILFLMLLYLSSVSQNVSKTGGVCFRVDDNPPLAKLNQFDSIFKKHNLNFCLAITSWTLPVSLPYVTKLKEFISSGHEVMDNTPTHQTQYFTLLNAQDTALYSNDWGVDHFNGSQVCLKYTSVDTMTNHNEGRLNISGNQVISVNPGEFANLSGDPYFFAFYLNSTRKVYLWYDLQNINPNDPDTLKLKSFWGEPVDLGTLWWARYHKLMPRDVHMNPYSVRLLGMRSIKIFDDLAIQRPLTWIHPRGQMPWINALDIKSKLGDSLGYSAGSNFINAAYFCYNELNPSKIKQFSLQSGDISIENNDLQWNKSQIANSFAKHYVKVDVSGLSKVQNDWNSYLRRVDSLLAWCVTSNIPVKTYREWSGLLYDSIPSRVENIFPKLNMDLDADNFPDGYDQDTTFGGIFQVTGGVDESGGRCFIIPGAGDICQVTALGGLEKGANKFSIWLKRTAQDSSNIQVVFNFSESGIIQTLEFPVSKNTWDKQQLIVDVPESASLVNILIKNEGQNQDTVMISGMDFKTTGFLKTSKFPEQKITANEPFVNIDLNTLVVETMYPPSEITWTFRSIDTLHLSILPGMILKTMKPVSFWSGKDSAFLIAHSPDGLKDSCLFKFTSIPIAPDCSGVPITLALLDTLYNDVIIWKSDPYDSSISDSTIYNPTVAPDTTTQYIVTCINPLGNINRDTITLIRYPFPVPGLPADVTICAGGLVRLTAQDGIHFKWNTGNPADTLASLIVNPASSRYYSVLVTNVYDCSASDSTLVNVVEYPIARLYGLLPSYCADDYTATLNGTPPNGMYGSTSPGLIGNQFFPNLANPGVNVIWYTYINSTGCGDTDTVKVIVNPLPVVKRLPDTLLCGGNTITLDAGSGFDNYQWSNGSVDSQTTVDSIGHGLGIYAIWVYVTKNGCVDKDTAYIEFITCPGIQDKDFTDRFSVYPNPVSDEIIVKVKSNKPELLTIQITNINGQVIRQMILENVSNSIPVSNLSKGIYFLRINQGLKRAEYKFLKI